MGRNGGARLCTCPPGSLAWTRSLAVKHPSDKSGTIPGGGRGGFSSLAGRDPVAVASLKGLFRFSRRHTMKVCVDEAFWTFFFFSLLFFFFVDFVSCLSRSDPCSCYRREESGSGGVPAGRWWAEFTWNNCSSVCSPTFSLPSLGPFEGVCVCVGGVGGGWRKGLKVRKHRTLDSLMLVTATQCLVLGNHHPRNLVSAAISQTSAKTTPQ